MHFDWSTPLIAAIMYIYLADFKRFSVSVFCRYDHQEFDGGIVVLFRLLK